MGPASARGRSAAAAASGSRLLLRAALLIIVAIPAAAGRLVGHEPLRAAAGPGGEEGASARSEEGFEGCWKPWAPPDWRERKERERAKGKGAKRGAGHHGPPGSPPSHRVDSADPVPASGAGRGRSSRAPARDREGWHRQFSHCFRLESAQQELRPAARQPTVLNTAARRGSPRRPGRGRGEACDPIRATGATGARLFSSSGLSMIRSVHEVRACEGKSGENRDSEAARRRESTIVRAAPGRASRRGFRLGILRSVRTARREGAAGRGLRGSCPFPIPSRPPGEPSGHEAAL